MTNDRLIGLKDFFEVVRDNTLLGVLITISILIILQAISHRTIDRLVEQAVRRHKHTNRAEEHKRETTLKGVFRTSFSVFIWTVGLILILWQLHVNLSALLTSAGLIGVIAGIGGQSAIKDCLAGIYIILENQLRVDDIVTISTPTATVSGKVEEVKIRTTRLRDLDGNLHIMTNGSIGVITNMSYHFAQVNVDIFVTYDTDIDLVEQLIKEAGQMTAAKKQYKHRILEPIEMLRVDELSNTNVTLKALGTVKPGAQWDVAGDFRRNLKQLFDKHKIKAPYQTIVVEDENLTARKK